MLNIFKIFNRIHYQRQIYKIIKIINITYKIKCIANSNINCTNDCNNTQRAEIF